MIRHPNLTYIGHVAVFYVPSVKLDRPVGERTPRQMIHEYIMSHYGAYTHQKSNIQGYWSNRKQVVKDENERFEVSFDGAEAVPPFIDFLASLCGLLKEECLYLTMGYKSYLISPKE